MLLILMQKAINFVKKNLVYEKFRLIGDYVILG